MPPDQAAPSSRRPVLLKLLFLLAIYLAVQWFWPRPASVSVEGWRLLGIFLATVAGLMLHPLPGGAIVLLGVTASTLTGALPIGKALAGWANPSVWLVLAAFFISRALIK